MTHETRCAGTPLLAVAGEKAAIRIIHVGRMKAVACLQVQPETKPRNPKPKALNLKPQTPNPNPLAPSAPGPVSPPPLPPPPQGHGRSINDLRFLPSDPNMLLSCSSDESCRLWNVVTCQLAVIFGGWHGHRSAVLSLDVHMMGQMFASCGMDNRCHAPCVAHRMSQVSCHMSRLTCHASCVSLPPTPHA